MNVIAGKVIRRKPSCLDMAFSVLGNAGPVFSHFEFEVPGVNRMTDEQWKADVVAGQKPPPPEWTASFLVPGTMTMPRMGAGGGYQ